MKWVVDTSGWIEYFIDGPNADRFAPAIENSQNLIVSVISIYEVFRYYLAHASKEEGLEKLSFMRRGRVISVDQDLAAQAAILSASHQLAMADSLILATARQNSADLLTQDKDFKGLEGVRYSKKKK